MKIFISVFVISTLIVLGQSTPEKWEEVSKKDPRVQDAMRHFIEHRKLEKDGKHYRTDVIKALRMSPKKGHDRYSFDFKMGPRCKSKKTNHHKGCSFERAPVRCQTKMEFSGGKWADKMPFVCAFPLGGGLFRGE